MKIQLQYIGKKFKVENNGFTYYVENSINYLKDEEWIVVRIDKDGEIVDIFDKEKQDLVDAIKKNTH